MKLNRWAPLLGLAILFNATAADQIIALDDGRKIVLKDDFTWRYLPQATATPKATVIAEAAPVSTAAVIPATNAVSASGITGAVTFSPAQGGQLIQATQSGVTVVLSDPQWEDGKLVFQTEIRNHALQPVVEVDLAIELYDANGQVLLNDEFPVWRSIKRMASTYLRPAQVEDGNAIEAEVGQFEQYQIRAQISDITNRG